MKGQRNPAKGIRGPELLPDSLEPMAMYARWALGTGLADSLPKGPAHRSLASSSHCVRQR